MHPSPYRSHRAAQLVDASATARERDRVRLDSAAIDPVNNRRRSCKRLQHQRRHRRRRCRCRRRRYSDCDERIAVVRRCSKQQHAPADERVQRRRRQRRLKPVNERKK